MFIIQDYQVKNVSIFKPKTWKKTWKITFFALKDVLDTNTNAFNLILHGFNVNLDRFLML